MPRTPALTLTPRSRTARRPTARRAAAPLAAAALLLAVVAGGVLPGGAAAAQEPEFIASHRDWHAFSWTENGNKVCYMVSQPKRMEPANLRHGEVYLMVVDRPAENKLDVVNLQTGYPFQANSRVEVEINGTTFEFPTDQDKAWSPDAGTDRALIQAMRAGSDLAARGISQRGNNTSYSFSLLGFTAAHDEMARACGVSS